MERVYFDNAATTALDKEVLEAMLPYMTTHFGNPSTIYSYGRETRLAIETARKTVATKTRRVIVGLHVRCPTNTESPANIRVRTSF